MVTKGEMWGGEINQEPGINIYISLHKTETQQGSTEQHRELYSIFCKILYERKSEKRMNICVCSAESVCCTPETNTTL